MGNVIIVGIIIICVIVGVRETVKHFKGQSACCGGGTQGLTREKHRLEGKKAGEYTLKVTGMKCENCEIRVENAVYLSQPGLIARANRRKSEVRISYDREIDREKVKQAVQSAGYHVVDSITPDK